MKYYTWITDTVAIGELNADYKGFDVIVNLAYINPSFNKSLEHLQHRVSYIGDINTLLIEVGLWDSNCDTEYFGEALRTVIGIIGDNIIGGIIGRKKKKILFHCQSGKSRSVSFALAYLFLFENENGDTVEQLLEHIREKRPGVSPRKMFIEKVKEFVEK